MGHILILNGSPRAPRSNSKKFAALFEGASSLPTETRMIRPGQEAGLRLAVEQASQVLLVFPLYADSVPVPLLRFLNFLEQNPPASRPTISVLVNCGFLEPEQNAVAVRIIQLFCRQNGYPFGSALMIGSGEAILDTPFQWLARRKIRRLARSMADGKPCTLKVTMPLPKRLFLRASTAFWEEYGRRNGISRQEMETMDIEGSAQP